MKLIMIIVLLSIQILLSKSETVILENNIYVFSENEIYFDFFIINLEDNNNIKGKVLKNGKEISNIEFNIDKDYIKIGNESKVIALIKNIELPVNDFESYYINIEYKGVKVISKLNVYKPFIEDLVIGLKRQFSYFSYYGNDFFFDFNHPASDFIAESNFKYYFKTNGKAEKEIEGVGLNAMRVDKLYFPIEAKTASLKIVWKNPFTKKEVEVFPEYQVDIKLNNPSINTNFIQNYSFGDSIVLLRTSNLKFAQTYISDSTEITPEFSISDFNIKTNEEYEVLKKPTLNRSYNDDTYNIDLIIKLKDKSKKISKVRVEYMINAKSIIQGFISSEEVRKRYVENYMVLKDKQIHDSLNVFLKRNNIKKEYNFMDLLILDNSTNSFIESLNSELSNLKNNIDIDLTSLMDADEINDFLRNLVLNGYDIPNDIEIEKIKEVILKEKQLNLLISCFVFKTIKNKKDFYFGYNPITEKFTNIDGIVK